MNFNNFFTYHFHHSNSIFIGTGQIAIRFSDRSQLVEEIIQRENYAKQIWVYSTCFKTWHLTYSKYNKLTTPDPAQCRHFSIFEHDCVSGIRIICELIKTW